MSDESDIDVMNFVSRKGKRSSRIEDSGSSSDSPVEQCKKRKRVLRVASDPENGSSDSDSPLEKRASRARVPRVMSDVDENSDESGKSHWDEDDDDDDDEDDDDDYDCDTGEEEEEEENASEAYSSAGSEESESSSYSDWESLDEVEDPGVLQSVAAAAFRSYENKVCGNGPSSSSSSKAAAPTNYMSDSSDGQSEKCPICLRNFTTQEVGTPEACDHSFCVDCLQEWSRNVNTCPVDRRKFTVILVRRCLEGRVIRRIPVEQPRQQDEDEVQEDPTYCEVCGQCDREDRMLLCDGCDLGYHLECLDPPMDTVPLEEWFCPDCTLSNSGHLAEEVDIQDGELMALLEDGASVWGLSPLRPRLSRLLPRTRQSERVRATMMTRQREGDQQRDQAQPSTSSGIDSLEADSNTSAGSIRRRLITNTTRTAHKRRKTTRRKATRKRTKKRKTTAKRKPKVTTSSAKNSLNEVSKRRHKKRRKIKRKKRKATLRKVRRAARVVVPQSVKGRLAEHLGVRPPRRPGQTIPDVRPRMSTAIDFQRNRAGIPILDLFGQRDRLDYFSSGSDHEGVGDFGGSVSFMARPRTSAAHAARSVMNRKRVFPSTNHSISSIRLASGNVLSDTSDKVTDTASCDIIDSILNSQAVWHSKKSVVTIKRDGSLHIRRDGEGGTARRNTGNSGLSNSGVNRTEEGLTVRTDDRLSQINTSDAPVNVSEAGSSTSGHVTQAPMYPGRSGGGSARPPPGGSFQQFGGNRYSSNPSYHGYQSGRGYSNFPPPSSFDSRGTRAGYTNYLNNGPPLPFRSTPLRFRMTPRYPIRRPLMPPIRPQLHQQQIQQIPPSNVEEFQSKSDTSDSQKLHSARPEDEDEIDIYSDIEVGGGSGSGGRGGGGSEPDDGDRSVELGYEALPPPPVPPAMLMGMGGDALSDEEAGSDTELVIDDNIAPSSPPDNSDRYDPEEALNKPEIPESEKYDPAEPSNDTDEEEEAATKASISIPYPPHDTCTAASSSHLIAHSSSNSSASYLHSPTYGDSSVLGSDAKLAASGVQEVFKDCLTGSSSIVDREMGVIADEPSQRHSSVDDDEEGEECPNFSIYSATSMDIARRTGDDDGDEDIPLPKVSTDPELAEDAKVDSDGETEDNGVVDDRDENSNLSVGEELVGHKGESDNADHEEKNLKPDVESEDGDMSNKQPGISGRDDNESENYKVSKVVDTIQEPDVIGVKKLSLVEEIFGSDDNDSVVGGATSAVSAATMNTVPQTSVPPLGLEGLDTETISETEEAINFEDDLSQGDGFLTAEEDGEIPSVKRKKKKKYRKPSLGGSAGEEATSAKDQSVQDVIDCEEGEIVDDRPKQHETAKKDKKTEKKEKTKYEKDIQKNTDENFDITAKLKTVTSEEEKKKKKKKSGVDKTRTSKERAVLSSSENKDKSKDKSTKADDASIAWKKLSKSSKERNYRDSKSKPDADVSKGKEAGKKKDTAGKDGAVKKEKKKKEKRKDMERYDVRKVVTDRKRRDAFGRDLSRERSYTKSRSRSRGRSYDRSRGRSRSISRSRITRSKGRSPLKSRIRSRSRSRLESRSRSRIRSRSRSKTRTKVKSKDRLRKSRSKEKRLRGSRSRSRGRRSRTRSRSRSRNRSRLVSRSRSPVRSRERRDRSRERRGSQRCRYRDRRSWSHSWTPSWSRSRSFSCSSYTRSHTPTPRRYTRSYSHSFSRSWSRERHKRIPVIEKKSAAISKTAKKLTVIVPNTKDDSERHRKKEKKRKESKKNKETITAVEKRKKRKEKSPAPSKEVFTSGDNILVSVNFKSNKSSGSKDVSSTSGAIAVAVKNSSKRKLHDGSFELDRESTKKLKKDKGNKEKASPRQKNGGIAGDKTTVHSGEKKSKKGAQKAGNKASRVANLINKKPVAIIDLDQSPFREQTPSPRDLIVLSDSEEECVAKEGDREELTDALNNRRNIRPSSCSPKSSKQGTAPSSTIAHTPESQSPPMNAVGSYLVTSTGPKTPPEPQIKFSIAAKPQLRSISNPLREDEEDMMADEGGLDDLDQRIEEELDRGLGEMLHKGPNTPPEPRGPTTPCSPPTSPDVYDPFDPTKSGTPSPVGACTSMDGPPSPVHTPTEQLIQHSVIGQESPMVSDLEDLASKSMEARVITPTLACVEEGADQSSQSPERSKLSMRGDTTVTSSPSIVPETTSLPPPVPSDNEMSQPSDMVEGSEKSKQVSVSVPPPGPSVTLTDPNTAQSPEHSIPVVITSQPQNVQATPVKPQLFPTTNVKQVTQQQPITSTPTHSTASAPVFPTLTPANIASILCTPPPPLSRMAMFNTTAMAVPQIMIHHQQQQQQQAQAPQQHHIIGSPIVVQQRPLPSIVSATPEKLILPSVKLPPIRSAAVQNGEQTQTSQKQPQDTTTDVVDMDLESPYSPGSSEGDDLFDPPTDVKSSGTTTSFAAMSNERNRTVPQTAKNASKLPPPLAVMLHKSPSKPPTNQDKFDAIFGLSPLRPSKTTPSRATGRVASKTHHVKGTKAKQGRHDKFKGSKKEIMIKMDEDQLQILDDLPSSAVELQVKDKFLKKLNRQERVVEEVKLSLKPHYTKKHITKEEYKEILRRSVPKICHNKSGEINPIKISSLVEAYVKKYRYAKKKNAVTGKARNRTMWS